MIVMISEEFFELEKKETLNMLNASFTEAGSSPLKLHALSEHSKKHYGKRKLEQLQENVKQKIEKVLEKEVTMEESESEETIQQKAADMDKLTEIMKKQLQLTSKGKKNQILTIPAFFMWTRKKMKETLIASDYLIRQAQKLVKEKGSGRTMS